MQAELIVASGSHQGQGLRITQNPFVIGRNESSGLRIKSSSVSRQHCAIIAREGKFYVKDLGSRNGTFVNDQKLTDRQSCRIRSGDTLQVGKMKLTMRIGMAVDVQEGETTETAPSSETRRDDLASGDASATKRRSESRRDANGADVDPPKKSLSLDGVDLSAWGSMPGDKQSDELQNYAAQRATSQAEADKSNKASGSIEWDTNETNNSLGLSEEEERRRVLEGIRNQKSASSQIAASEAIRKMLGGGNR
ncbi:Oxoglutarate dehydrogenase inhibitor [Rosistilla carotiformis]|uniref:Oxoglutarate dehydrogenase inhibitor n=1 Tax=Rosistilla carotiformis TaxID=2528017 RepID=A0A518JZL0_9BACT|nr:FHA domain-containing protein [Rosistilla carotiformis]QDV70984.1 Oxoglutarate dehydrogenase inhibitor [Rosistilla carotiformis]